MAWYLTVPSYYLNQCWLIIIRTDVLWHSSRAMSKVPLWVWNLQIDGLVQDCSNSIANALELLQSCTKPSIFKLRATSPRSQWVNRHLTFTTYLDVTHHSKDKLPLWRCAGFRFQDTRIYKNYLWKLFGAWTGHGRFLRSTSATRGSQFMRFVIRAWGRWNFTNFKVNTIVWNQTISP